MGMAFAAGSAERRKGVRHNEDVITAGVMRRRLINEPQSSPTSSPAPNTAVAVPPDSRGDLRP